MFNEDQLTERAEQYNKAVASKDNNSLIPEDLTLPTKPKKERKQAVSFTMKPSLIKEVKRISKKHGYNSMSEYVNDVFEQLIIHETN